MVCSTGSVLHALYIYRGVLLHSLKVLILKAPCPEYVNTEKYLKLPFDLIICN